MHIETVKNDAFLRTAHHVSYNRLFYSRLFCSLKPVVNVHEDGSNISFPESDIETDNISTPSPLQPDDRVKWTVSEEERGTRLDRFVKRRAPGLPPGLIQRLIRQGRITVDDVAPRRNAYSLRLNVTVRISGDVKLRLTRGKRKPPPEDTILAESAEINKWILHRDATAWC